MADNTILNTGTGGDTIATDDIAGVKHQRVKVQYGVDGAATDVSDTNPLPVDDAGGSLTVDNAVLSVVGSGAEATAQRVTIATDSTGVLSVDDNGSSLTVDNAGTFAVQDSEKIADNAAFTDGTTRVQPAGYVFDEAAGTALTENDAAAARIDAKRAQICVIEDGSTRGTRATVTPSGALQVDGSNVTQSVSNAGTFATQESGGALTALQLLDDTIIADDAAFSVASTKVSVAGFLADQASTDSVNEGDAGAARMTLDRKQIVTVAPSADTEGLSASANLIDIDETEDEIKATAGKVYGWYLYNDGAAEVYVKFYNATAANVTVGTTTPSFTIGIPAGGGANVEWTNGIAFSTAITVAATTGIAVADATAPAANQVSGVILFQ